MARSVSGFVGRQIEFLFEGGSVAGLTDRQLLEQFIAERDSTGEAAFAALVTRHGPMVQDVCRQVVGDLHHAEDAFQAVFLVLARKARSIRDPDLLGNWLYGVARRTASEARARLARQRKNEENYATRHPGSGFRSSAKVEPMSQSAEQAVLAREQIEALHGEIDRLPGPFRVPVVLCYFEGLTLDEAARRLQWPPGTVRSRLARARDKLRRGLMRRGVILRAAALGSVLSTKFGSGHVSSLLCDATTKAAINFAGRQAGGEAVSGAIMALAQKVIRSMLLDKMRIVLLTFLAFSSVVTSIGYWTDALAMKDEPGKAPAGKSRTASQADAPNLDVPGRMFIIGHVLDPQGKPVAGAKVIAYASDYLPARSIGQALSDEAGLFRLAAPRSSSARNDRVGAVAFAPGYGAGWVELDPAADQPTADIALRREQVINGRLFDLQGRPARDVTVSLRSIRHRDLVKSRIEGPGLSWSDPNDLPGWPKTAITDSEGRFTMHGIGRDLRVSLNFSDPRYALQDVEIETDGNSDSKHVTMALQPAQIISGHVTYADSGKPASHAELGVRADKAGVGTSTSFQADAEGRFRVNPSSGDHFVLRANPPEGQPYLKVFKSFDWPKGAVEYSVDLALPRGVLISGKVIEGGSGKPVAGANVMFSAQSRPGSDPGTSSNQARTAFDGSFQLAATPGPGHLAIRGPSEDYVLQAIGERLYFDGQPGGRRLYSNAFVACEPKSGQAELRVNVVLRRGATVRGQLIGLDGQPVRDAWMISRIMLEPWLGVRQIWRGDAHRTAHNGRFALYGLDPDTEVPIYFLEPNRKLGATASFSGKLASVSPVTVHLEPCGAAKARIVDRGGKAVAGFSKPWLISMVVTPGPSASSKVRDEGLLLADEARLQAVDPINYEHVPMADGEGRITFPALILGMAYRVIDRTTFREPAGPQVRKEFTAKRGETLELGDILIEKPGG